MKKYKLKKEFPSSKIGDVWVKADNGFMSPEGRESIKMHKHLFKPFNDWFEDYEEPQIYYWYIDDLGIVSIDRVESSTIEMRKNFCNHFDTREEAEQAVEKLKAFKRLQDLGFRFDGIRYRNKYNYIEWKIEPKNELTDDETAKIIEDLCKVFGGKE